MECNQWNVIKIIGKGIGAKFQQRSTVLTDTQENIHVQNSAISRLSTYECLVKNFALAYDVS